MEFIKYLFGLFLISYSYAASAKVVDINLAAFTNSKSVFRGAIFWSAPSYFVGPGLSFYNKLHISGPRIEYRFFERQDKWGLNLRTLIFNDGEPPLTFGGSRISDRNSRDNSMHFEVDASRKFGYRNAFAIGSRLSYEFKEYGGVYWEPYFRVPVAPFVSLQIQSGIGEKDSNQYLYGDNAASGFGYLQTGLRAFIPLNLGRLIVSLSYFSVLQDQNRKGVLVDGQPDNLVFRAFYVVKLY